MPEGGGGGGGGGEGIQDGRGTFQNKGSGESRRKIIGGHVTQQQVEIIQFNESAQIKWQSVARHPPTHLPTHPTGEGGGEVAPGINGEEGKVEGAAPPLQRRMRPASRAAIGRSPGSGAEPRVTHERVDNERTDESQ